tara:strand:- start:477 stop:764 length:288 start_codon:yes stop_codon:yes gene_type:complete
MIKKYTIDEINETLGEIGVIMGIEEGELAPVDLNLRTFVMSALKLFINIGGQNNGMVPSLCDCCDPTKLDQIDGLKITVAVKDKGVEYEVSFKQL